MPNIATKECRTCGAMGHISKACKRSPKGGEKNGGNGAKGTFQRSKVEQGKGNG